MQQVSSSFQGFKTETDLDWPWSILS